MNKLVGFFNMYRGASESTSIDFDAAYNNPKQQQGNGVRTQENVGEQAFDQLACAKKLFREACATCEYCHSDACKTKQFKEAIFWRLVKEPKARRRFCKRTANDNVSSGLKTTSCTNLLSERRLKDVDWKE
ncbi:MAG: hypothetical protein LBT19_01275 [Candidatus Nomurabacteria bacterium]|nr:hypothetical protein [Candidatus Nomurabacteria bacterium]